MDFEEVIFAELAKERAANIVAPIRRHILAFQGHITIPLARNKTDVNRVEVVEFSGFLFEVQGHWFLVTAGHIFSKEADSLYSRVMRDGLGWRWWLNVAQPGDIAPRDLISFDFPPEDLKYECNEALHEDWAFIYISPEIAHKIELEGLIPFNEKHVGNEPTPRPDNLQYVLLGYPSQLRQWERDKDVNPEQKTISVSVSIALINYSEKEGDEGRVGGVLYDFPSEASDFDDITGMSGGVLFRYWFDNAGIQHYHVVGIQSRWDSATRQIYVQPIRHVITKIHDYIEEQLNSGGA